MTWPLRVEQPVVVVRLTDAFGLPHDRTLLADTGAGHDTAPFELVLSFTDCERFGNLRPSIVGISGAIEGIFPIFKMWVEVPQLEFRRKIAVVAVPHDQLPEGLDGIAAFRFLNSFTYGNFGNSAEFGLETK